MPYGIRRKGKKYQTVNRETGDVKGTHATRAEAERQRRLLEGIEHGWHPTHQKGQLSLFDQGRRYSEPKIDMVHSETPGAAKGHSCWPCTIKEMGMKLKDLAVALKMVKNADPKIVASLADDAALEKASGAIHDVEATSLTREQIADVIWNEGQLHRGANKEEIKTGPAEASSGGGAEKMVRDYSRPAPQMGITLEAESLTRIMAPMMATQKAHSGAIATLIETAKATSAMLTAIMSKAEQEEDDEEEESEESEVVEINASKAKRLIGKAKQLLAKAEALKADLEDETDRAARKAIRAEIAAARKSAAKLLVKARTAAYAAGKKGLETRKSIVDMATADALLKADINVVQEEEEEEEEEEGDAKAKAAAAAKAEADAAAKAAADKAAAEAAKAVTDNKGNQADRKDPMTGNQDDAAKKAAAPGDADALKAQLADMGGKISKALEGFGMLRANVNQLMDVVAGKSRIGADMPELAKASTQERETKIMDVIREKEDAGELSPANALAARDIVQYMGMAREGKIDATIAQSRLEKAPAQIRDLFKQAA